MPPKAKSKATANKGRSKPSKVTKRKPAKKSNEKKPGTNATATPSNPSGNSAVNNLENKFRKLSCGNCGKQVVCADNRDSDVSDLFSTTNMITVTTGSKSKAIYNLHLPILASHSGYFSSFLSNANKTTSFFDTQRRTVALTDDLGTNSSLPGDKREDVFDDQTAFQIYVSAVYRNAYPDVPRNKADEVTHAKVYVMADRLLSPDVKSMALEKLRFLLGQQHNAKAAPSTKTNPHVIPPQAKKDDEKVPFDPKKALDVAELFYARFDGGHEATKVVLDAVVENIKKVRSKCLQKLLDLMMEDVDFAEEFFEKIPDRKELFAAKGR